MQGSNLMVQNEFVELQYFLFPVCIASHNIEEEKKKKKRCVCIVSRITKRKNCILWNRFSFLFHSLEHILKNDYWCIILSLAKSDLTLSNCQSHFLYLKIQLPHKQNTPSNKTFTCGHTSFISVISGTL